jgi:hypothetical protein
MIAGGEIRAASTSAAVLMIGNANRQQGATQLRSA